MRTDNNNRTKSIIRLILGLIVGGLIVLVIRLTLGNPYTLIKPLIKTLVIAYSNGLLVEWV